MILPSMSALTLLQRLTGLGLTAATLAFLISAPIRAFAQSGSATTAAAPPPVEQHQPPPGFVPVAGAPDTQKIDANKLVVAAYAAFFAGIFGYVVYVARRQSEIAKEMSELAARIDKAGK